jgi:rhamnulose-1-phosphate aldolase
MRTIPKSLEPQCSEIARVAGILFQRDWAERNAGNLSWRVNSRMKRPDEHDLLLITARNSRMRDIARDPASGLLLISARLDTGEYSILAGVGEPTSETPTHLRLQNQQILAHTPNRVVLHTHPKHLTALTHHPQFRDENAVNQLLRTMHPEISFFLWEGVGWAPYQCPGSAELACVAEIALTDHPVALLDRHGVIAVGETPDDALDRIDLAERAAAMWFLCRSAGFDPVGLTQRELDAAAAAREAYRLRKP